MKRMIVTLTAALFTLTAQAADAPKPATTSTTLAAAPVPVSPAADKTSALFFSTCTTSMDGEKDFAKKMGEFVKAKTAVKLPPEKLTGMIDPEEAKNAWAFKGFADPNKPLVMAYNTPQNICTMHVSDIDTTQVRHAFQADLKKVVDATQAKVKVYKPETKGDITVYSADLVLKDKVMQLGIAISKDGKAFLTSHL